jgi:uncharacterized protein YacL
MLEALLAYLLRRRSGNMKTRRRILMTRRQVAFGAICLLIGLLIGMAIAEHLDLLIHLVVIVAIILLCVYLGLPYVRPRTRTRRNLVQRVSYRRTQRKP